MGQKNLVLVGGGLSALLSAVRLREIYPTNPIFIVEKENELGGIYKSYDYGSFGYFDIGMHILYETCIPEIDKVMIGALPESEWNFFDGNDKDIAGLYFNGRLQTYSPYADLRTLGTDTPTYRNAVADFFSQLKNPVDRSNAQQYFETRFGKTIAKASLEPAFQKLYQRPVSELSYLAPVLSASDRVILFDPDVMLDLMKSDLLRERLGYADQMSLPLKYRSNGQRALYPKKFGMVHLIKSLETKLGRMDIQFLTGSTVSSLKLTGDQVHSITVTTPNGDRTLDNIGTVYWTSGLTSLASTLGIKQEGFVPDKSIKSYYVNFLLDQAPKMDRLYYFYCYDPRYSTFRVTSYANYCPEAASGGLYPVCVEIWPDAHDTVSTQLLIDKAWLELKAFGVVDDSVKAALSRVETTHGGFPMPTVKNVNHLTFLREQIAAKGIGNLKSMGVLSEENVFFFKDVLIDAFRKVEA